MYAATKANVRTATAAQKMVVAASVSFYGGSVMGLCSLIGLDRSWIFIFFLMDETGVHALEGLEWVLQLLSLSRVGGDIFTKSADVGADLVGKVEAGIPEDDPRNQV